MGPHAAGCLTRLQWQCALALPGAALDGLALRARQMPAGECGAAYAPSLRAGAARAFPRQAQLS